MKSVKQMVIAGLILFAIIGAGFGIYKIIDNSIQKHKERREFKSQIEYEKFKDELKKILFILNG